MPQSYRFIIAALGLICLTALGQAQEQNQEPQTDSEKQQNISPTLPVPLPVEIRQPLAVEIVDDVATTEARQHQQQESTQREIDDLLAQQGMHEATRAMNEATQDMRDYALYSTIFVGVGTVLLIVTLWLTRQANKAAQSAVDVTRQIGEAQIRAYLYCRSAKYRYSKDGVVAILDIENAGQSPASNVEIRGCAGINLVGGLEVPRVQWQIFSTMDDTSCAPVPVGQSISEEMYYFWDLSFEENAYEMSAKEAFNSGNEIWFDLEVLWTDVFKQRHSFKIDLFGDVAPGPWNRRKRRVRSGKLFTRMGDAHHGVTKKDAN